MYRLFGHSQNFQQAWNMFLPYNNTESFLHYTQHTFGILIWLQVWTKPNTNNIEMVIHVSSCNWDLFIDFLDFESSLLQQNIVVGHYGIWLGYSPRAI